MLELEVCAKSGSTGCTKHGLTKGFDLKTSVRQGDPLAPLLFILLADMLHKGLRVNPLFDGAIDGYKFSTQQDLVVSSIGYADDFMIFSESRDGIAHMHAWVREFCGAHEMEINAKKTVFITSGCRDSSIPILVNVEGDEVIEPHTDEHFFKYLGVWIRVKRDTKAWSKQLQVTSRNVSIMRGKIYSNRLDILIALHVCNTLLVPQIELAGRFASFTNKV